MKLLQHGSKIGVATVIVDIIGKGNPEIRPQTKMTPKKITTHNTGNSGRGANAKSHNTYIHNLASYHPKDTTHISWHITVDDKYIYQHIPLDEAAYHCGDGWGINSGNRTSIGIEICENPETNTHQAEENAIALTVLLLKELKLDLSDVHPHKHWSGKYCPRVILKRDGSFNPYRKRIEIALSSVPSTDKIMWGKTELKKGQKGKITVLQDTKVWEDSPHSSSEIVHTRTLKKDGEFRVYDYRPDHGGQYYLGANEWVTKMPEDIKYETPSKAMLEKLNK